jgi:hypothetical protein
MTSPQLTPKGTEHQLPNAVERRHAHWAEARSAVGFLPREPSWVPSDYWMSALQSWRIENDPQAQILIATFTGPIDSYFTVEQSAIRQPFEIELKQPAPDSEVSSGVVEIHGQPAQWRIGVRVGDPNDERAFWDTSIVSVGWSEGDVLYRLDGRGLDIAVLVRVARSLA